MEIGVTMKNISFFFFYSQALYQAKLIDLIPIPELQMKHIQFGMETKFLIFTGIMEILAPTIYPVIQGCIGQKLIPKM